MSLGNVGQNATEEFFETVISLTAVSGAREATKEYIQAIDNPVLREAAEGASSVIVFGAMNVMFRYEQEFIELIFKYSTPAIIALMAFPKKALAVATGSGFLSKFKRFAKGVGAKAVGNYISHTDGNNIARAQVLSSVVGNQFSARNNEHTQSNLLGTSLQNRQNILARDKSSQDLGVKMAEVYAQTAMFKAFTGTFQDSDKKLLKKITGKSSIENIDDWNVLADTMYSKDSDGKVIGLSTLFLETLNASKFERA